jgi:hypothetical protein
VSRRYQKELVHDLGDGHAPEANTLLGVQIRDVGDEAAHASRATDGLGDGHLTHLDVAVLLDQLGDILERHCYLLSRRSSIPDREMKRGDWLGSLDSDSRCTAPAIRDLL